MPGSPRRAAKMVDPDPQPDYAGAERVLAPVCLPRVVSLAGRVPPVEAGVSMAAVIELQLREVGEQCFEGGLRVPLSFSSTSC